MSRKTRIRYSEVVLHQESEGKETIETPQSALCFDRSVDDTRVEGLRIGHIYSIDTPIIEDASGKYAGTNIISDEKVGILVASSQDKSQLEREARVLEILTGSPGIPFLLCFCEIRGHKVMVYDASGPSLEDLLKTCNGKFTLKTVLMVFDQLITRFEWIHSKFLIHRDIKPSKLAMGFSMRGNQVMITGFNCAKRYSDPKTNVHIPPRTNQKFAAGEFSSINTHLGKEQSRRDDLESLGYVMLYFLHGSLPGQEKLDLSLEKKRDTLALCHGLPQEFEIYLSYTRSLSFDETPDYDYLRKLVRGRFANEGFIWDYNFDWLQGTLAFSQEQLVAEFKYFFEDLKKSEWQCIRVGYSLAKDPSGASRRLQELFRLHRELLWKFYNCFLISQHPSAPPTLRRLASEYCMPQRLWDCIHGFLDLLRRGLLWDAMLSSVYFAYSTMALLLEEFPDFEDTWFECLGDISRYGALATHGTMEVWTDMARIWYLKALDKHPETGKLYFHLGILAPNPIQQLFYYCKALCAKVPYSGERESALTGFHDILEQSQMQTFKDAQLLNNSTLEIVLRSQRNALSKFPWQTLSNTLNALLAEHGKPERVISRLQKDNDLPLPEDNDMRGLCWTGNYFPEERFARWSATKNADELDKTRIERILSLAIHLENSGYGLSYDCLEHKFSAVSIEEDCVDGFVWVDFRSLAEADNG